MLGLGLALVLVLVLSSGSTAENQVVHPGVTVDLTYNAIWGKLAAGDVVTVTRSADGAFGAAETDGVGFFWTPLWTPNGQSADVAPGDVLEIHVNGMPYAAVTPGAITGAVDVLSDRVTGNVSGLAAGSTLTVTLGDSGSMVSDVPRVVTTVDGSGDFAADFSGVADIGPHHMAQVQIRDGSGTKVQAYAYPAAVFTVYGWNAVLGYAQPAAAVTATVYSAYPTAVRWTDSTTAGATHGDYRIEGDIEYGDVVEMDLGGGTLISVTAAYLEVRPDAATDQITGVAPAGATVRGHVWFVADGVYFEETDVADGSGNFTLDWSVGLNTRQQPYVAYADAEGDEVGYAPMAPHIRAYPDWSNVWAMADQPNQPVTYTLKTGIGTTTITGQCGKNNMCDTAPFESVQSGNTVTVVLPSRTMTMTVADVTIALDTANDAVIGEIDIPGWTLAFAYQWQDQWYPIHGNTVARAAVSPPTYTVPFGGFDIRDGMGLIWVAHYSAANGHRTFGMKDWDRLAHFEVQTPWDVTGVPISADETVTATLYTSDGVELATSSTDDQEDPWRFRLSFHGEQQIEPGRWVTVTSESGWHAGLQVPELTVQADADTDLIWGQGPESLLYLKYDYTGGWNQLFAPCDGYVIDIAYYGHDLRVRDYIEAIYQAPNGNRVRSQITWPIMRAHYSEDLVLGDYPAGHTFWVTVTNSGAVKATAQVTSVVGGGRYGQDGFEIHGPEWSPPNVYLRPGNWVLFQADDGYSADIHIGSISAAANTQNDTVSGRLYAPWFTQTLQGTVKNFHWWGMGGPDFSADPDGGSFVVDLSPHDVVSGTDFDIEYNEPDGDQVMTRFIVVEPSELGFDLGVNYGHDWVNGHCEAGHTIWITATQSDGVTVKATGVVTSADIPAWGGEDGFEGGWVEWTPSAPDIEPGDWVFGRADGGETRSVLVGTIAGFANAASDSVAGTVDADWLDGAVEVTFYGWSGAPEGVPSKQDIVFPDNADTFSCSWDPVTEWDVQPGQEIGLNYREPDGDAVFNAFEISSGIYLPLLMRNN